MLSNEELKDIIEATVEHYDSKFNSLNNKLEKMIDLLEVMITSQGGN